MKGANLAAQVAIVTGASSGLGRATALALAGAGATVVLNHPPSTFLCARGAVREFLRRGPQPAVSSATGKLIFTSSVHEIVPWAFQINYAASKGGMSLLMKSLAQELAPARIRVNSVAPGAVRTSINADAWETERALKQLHKLIPYGRIGEPEDVARAIVWLASDQSDYVIGTSLLVDGGMTLYPGFRGEG